MKQKIIVMILYCMCVALYAQEPAWIYSPTQVYPNASYLVAVGEGKTRLEAEANAFGNVSRIFGTNVSVDARSQARYDENSVNRNAVQNTTVLASHDLINASIDDTYYNATTKTFYAVAVIPRRETSQILLRMITENNTAIESYVLSAEYESDLLYKFSLLDMAAIIAEKNDVFINQYGVLNQTGLASTLSPYNVRQLKAQALSVARSMSFSVVTSEQSILQSRIEESVATLGMRINRTNPTYIFTVSSIYTGTDSGYGMFIINYVTNIELSDNEGNILSVFTYSGREGGRTEEDAMRILQNKLAESIAHDNPEKGNTSLVTQFSLFLDTLI